MTDYEQNKNMEEKCRRPRAQLRSCCVPGWSSFLRSVRQQFASRVVPSQCLAGESEMNSPRALSKAMQHKNSPKLEIVYFVVCLPMELAHRVRLVHRPAQLNLHILCPSTSQEPGVVSSLNNNSMATLWLSS